MMTHLQGREPSVCLDAEGHAYNEQTFRYFLATERTRAERAGRSLVLLLVRIKKAPGASSHIGPAVATKVFVALSETLREVDFSGWLRHGRIAAAVLAQRTDCLAPLTRQRLVQRVTAALEERVPGHVARRIQVRAFEQRVNVKG